MIMEKAFLRFDRPRPDLICTEDPPVVKHTLPIPLKEKAKHWLKDFLRRLDEAGTRDKQVKNAREQMANRYGSFPFI